MSNKYCRELLVFGYGRQNYDNKIPVDVLALCLLLFGLDGFSFAVKSKQLTDLIKEQQEYQQPQNTDTNHPQIKSPIFYSNHIKYQIKINARMASTNNSWSLGGVSKTKNTVRFNINIIDPQTINKQKITKIILLIIIHCNQTNMEVRCVINSDLWLLSKTNITRSITNALINENTLNQHNIFEIHGNIEILHIEFLNKISRTLSIYHPDIFMNKQVEYKWKLNNNMIPYKRNKFNCYYSQLFDNNTWCIIFQDNTEDNTFSVITQLIQLPYNVSKLEAYCKCEMIINNNNYSNAKIAKPSFKTSSWNWGNQNNNNPSKKDDEFLECGNLSTGHIGTWNKDIVLGTSNSNFNLIDLDSITLIVTIQIFKVFKERHVTDPESILTASGRNTFSWGNSVIDDRNVLSNSQLNSFGIIDKKECFSNNDKHIVIYNNLLLQKEIKHVKIKKQALQTSTANAFSFGGDRSKSQFKFTLCIDENNDTDSISGDEKSDIIPIGFSSGNIPQDQITSGNTFGNTFGILNPNNNQNQTNQTSTGSGGLFNFSNNQNSNLPNTSDIFGNTDNNQNKLNNKSGDAFSFSVVGNQTNNQNNNNDEKNNNEDKYEMLENSLKTIIQNEMNKLFDCIQQNNNDNDNGSNHPNDILIDKVEYKINMETSKEVKTWLDSIGFKIYSKIFILNGFDSMDMIKEIKTKNDLQYIGVKLKAHQIKILNNIRKLPN